MGCSLVNEALRTVGATKSLYGGSFVADPAGEHTSLQRLFNLASPTHSSIHAQSNGILASLILVSNFV
jgi:hypothetical protein